MIEKREARSGDKVRILPGAIGTARDYIGRVVEMTDDRHFRADDGYTYPLSRAEFEFAEEPAREPRVGDRVRFTDKCEGGWWFKAGETGTIDFDDEGATYRYYVKVDGKPGLGTAFVAAQHIEIIGPATEPAQKRTPKAGDLVRILPGAIGVAREFVGRTVQISLAEGGRVRFECDGRSGSLLDREWEFADREPTRAPVSLREGGYYRAESGDVIGPMRLHGKAWHNGDCSGRSYNQDGTPFERCSVKDPLVAEVPAPGAVPSAEPRSKEDVEVGDFVRVLPVATDDASRYIGQTVLVTSVDDDGSGWIYFRGDDQDEDDEEEIILIPGEWEPAETQEPLGEPAGSQIDAGRVAATLERLAPPAPATERRRPVVGDLLVVLPAASGPASAYAGETVEVTTVDHDGDPYFADWKHDADEECLLVSGEWEFRGDEP